MTDASRLNAHAWRDPNQCGFSVGGATTDAITRPAYCGLCGGYHIQATNGCDYRETRLPLVMLTLRFPDGREVTLGRAPKVLLDDEIERTVHQLLREWLQAVRAAGIPVA